MRVAVIFVGMDPTPGFQWPPCFASGEAHIDTREDSDPWRPMAWPAGSQAPNSTCTTGAAVDARGMPWSIYSAAGALGQGVTAAAVCPTFHCSARSCHALLFVDLSPQSPLYLQVCCAALISSSRSSNVPRRASMRLMEAISCPNISRASCHDIPLA